MMNSTVTMAWEILDRMEQAVATVRERLLRTTTVLNGARIPYAVVGGHAVAFPGLPQSMKERCETPATSTCSSVARTCPP
jgi:hypothetical protein